jgi:hypothetical protein
MIYFLNRPEFSRWLLIANPDVCLFQSICKAYLNTKI